MQEHDDDGADEIGIHRVKLETYNRGQVITMVLVFVALFLISLGASVVGPFVWRASHGWSDTYDNCTGVAHHSECQACVTSWEGEVVNMNPYHQVMYLEMALENPRKFVVDWNTEMPFNEDMFLKEMVRDVKAIEEGPLDFQIRTEMQVTGVADDGNYYTVLPFTTMTRRVVCDRFQDWCRNVTVFAQNSVKYDRYLIKAKFYHPKQFWCQTWKNGGSPGTRLEFTMRYMNASFTTFELGFKYIFVGISTIAFAAFGLSISKLGRNTSYEQKWILALMGLLILYNDPLFIIDIYSASLIWGAFMVLFNVTFLTALLSFWLCMLDVVRTSASVEYAQESRGTSFYLPKAILMTAFWFSTVAVYMWTRLQQNGDPMHNEPSDLKHFVFMKLISFGVLGVYGIWIVYLIVSSARVLRRLRLGFVFFFGLTAFVLTVTFIGVALGAYSPLPVNKTSFLPFLMLSNLYVLTLAWAYQPGDTLSSGAGGAGGAGLHLENVDRDQMVRLGQEDEYEEDPSEGQGVEDGAAKA